MVPRTVDGIVHVLDHCTAHNNFRLSDYSVLIINLLICFDSFYINYNITIWYIYYKLVENHNHIYKRYYPNKTEAGRSGR